MAMLLSGAARITQSKGQSSQQAPAYGGSKFCIYEGGSKAAGKLCTSQQREGGGRGTYDAIQYYAMHADAEVLIRLWPVDLWRSMPLASKLLNWTWAAMGVPGYYWLVELRSRYSNG